MDTSIAVKVETKERLAKLGVFRDSFDSLLNRILDHYEGCKQQVQPPAEDPAPSGDRA